MRGKFLPSNSWKRITARTAVNRWRTQKKPEEFPLTFSGYTVRTKEGV
jgi:hypothetical protein